jgi:hypothetical protein
MVEVMASPTMRRWRTRPWATVLVVLLAFLLVGCGKPSVETACRDYVHALNESDDALAAEAVQRLAEWSGENDESFDLITYIGQLANIVKWGIIVSDGFPKDSYFATALYFACGEEEFPEQF